MPISNYHLNDRPAAANLENPLYYLENMETVVSWVANHHSDLLLAPENARLNEFFDLSRHARALLTRMVMRSGDLFRADKLKYPELGSSEMEALNDLVESDWLNADPLVTLDDLFRLFTLAELRPRFAPVLVQAGFAKNLAKAQMRKALTGIYGNARTVMGWLGDSGSPVVRVSSMALFDRVRLMFFGNLRQSWSDFVLVELGHHRYEKVHFTPEARAFSKRSEADVYLAMHHCRECLDAGMPAAEVWAQVPQPSDNPWLTSRRDRLLLELGRQAERQGEQKLALEALASSGHREARLKQLRLLERMKRFDEAWIIAADWKPAELSDAEAQGLARILKRLAAKVKQPAPLALEPPPLHEFTLTLPQTGSSVERVVRDHLSSPEAPVFYMENTLINSLFGLLCWSTIFKPIPGAFFHPFHNGPADLLRENFVSRRQTAFDQCFAMLNDGGYRQQILNTYAAKQGITNPFVTWPALNDELLALALDCIPALDLHIIFERLLLNIREHRSGFPDLVRFYPENPRTRPRYEMIEVKGPGDRLQDHQIRWLQFFARKGIAASVCYLRWQASEAAP
ncbi:MAG: VRR-NUC domain-containing protein [Marinobacter sp.]